MFRDFPTFSRTWIFFLLRLSLFWSSFFFSSLLWLFPSLLFICPYCRKFDFYFLRTLTAFNPSNQWFSKLVQALVGLVALALVTVLIGCSFLSLLSSWSFHICINACRSCTKLYSQAPHRKVEFPCPGSSWSYVSMLAGFRSRKSRASRTAVVGLGVWTMRLFGSHIELPSWTWLSLSLDESDCSSKMRHVMLQRSSQGACGGLIFTMIFTFFLNMCFLCFFHNNIAYCPWAILYTYIRQLRWK